MASSNTKLFPYQKQQLKAFKKNQAPGLGYFLSFPVYGVTFFVVTDEAYNGSNPKMLNLSVAHCSSDELKFRPKVGEYYALTNFKYGDYIKIPGDSDFESMASAMRVL